MIVQGGEEVRGKLLQVFVDFTITLCLPFFKCILIFYEISSVVKMLTGSVISNE